MAFALIEMLSASRGLISEWMKICSASSRVVISGGSFGFCVGCFSGFAADGAFFAVVPFVAFTWRWGFFRLRFLFDVDWNY